MFVLRFVLEKYVNVFGEDYKTTACGFLQLQNTPGLPINTEKWSNELKSKVLRRRHCKIKREFYVGRRPLV